MLFGCIFYFLFLKNKNNDQSCIKYSNDTLVSYILFGCISYLFLTKNNSNSRIKYNNFKRLNLI